MLLAELKETTDLVFENKIQLPEPPILWKDKLAALESANLTSHYSSCLFDMRCEQAKQLGFQRIESRELVKMLMGENFTHEEDGTERQTHEWVYDHHNDEDITAAKWGGVPTIFKKITKKGFWYLPPFSKKVIWTAIFGKLNNLKRDIPYGVVLRINECKELKLFNCFNVLAPLEAWERKTDIDPIVVATIWEMPPKEDATKNNTAGQAAHFFLAQW